MKSLIIIQDNTDLETIHEQVMDYLQAKYHTYPHVFERIPGTENEVGVLASKNKLYDDNVPVGKLVL